MSFRREVRIAWDEVLAHRDVGWLPEKWAKAVNEAHTALRCPLTPVRDLDAVAVACLDVVGPGIDDQSELAFPLAADLDDLVEILACQLQPAAARFVHDLRIDAPACAPAFVGRRRAERHVEPEIV